MKVIATPIELIRQRPTMFFVDGRVTLESLIQRVVQDVLESEASYAQVHREGSYAMVSANSDWMGVADVPVPDLFTRFIDTASRKKSEFRAEVLIAAVCSGYRTAGPSGEHAVDLSTSDIPAAFDEAIHSSQRMLIFRLA